MKALLLRFIAILVIIHSCQGQDFKTPVGNPCNQSEDCVSNSECVTSFCQCQSGYSATPDLECKINYNGNCIEDSDCNVHMGLGCVKSFCQCSEILEHSYIHEIGGCINATVKVMYDDILKVVNQTEFELSRFTTLLHLFMIHGSSGGNQLDTASSDLAPNVFQIQELEHLFGAEQGTVEVIVSPPSSGPVGAQVPVGPQTPVVPQTPVGSQTPVGPLTPVAPQTTPPQVQTESPKIQRQIASPAPVTEQSTLPNSFGNLILPILPSQPSLQNEGLPNLQNLGQQILPSLLGSPNLGPPSLPIPGTGVPGGVGSLASNGFLTINQEVDSLVNVLPQFLNRFRTFLPFLQSFNNILGSTILNPTNPGLLQQPGPAGILGLSGIPGLSGISGLVNPSLFGQAGPAGLLRIPGRIFNSLFGRNSTINQLKRRILPFDITRKAIPFLPWPLG